MKLVVEFDPIHRKVYMLPVFYSFPRQQHGKATSDEPTPEPQRHRTGFNRIRITSDSKEEGEQVQKLVQEAKT